jgi:hypothetical protein
MSPWSTVFLVKLIITPQLSRNSQHFMETEVHCRFHNSPRLVSILSQIHSVHAAPFYFFIPSIAISKPHVNFRSLTSLQTICPSLRLCKQFYNMLRFYSEELFAPSPNLKLEDQTLICWPSLVTKCIRSYPSCLKTVCCIRKLMTPHVGLLLTTATKLATPFLNDLGL